MIGSCFKLLRAGGIAGIILAGAQWAYSADISTYYVRKGLIYTQTSAAAPAPLAGNPALFIARVDGSLTSVTDVLLSTPSPFYSLATMDFFGDHYEFTVPGSAQDVDVLLPNGTYTFTFEPDSTIGTLTLAAGAFPTPVPQVLNLDAAQNINADSNFTLNFSPYTGAGVTDRFEFEVLEQGSVVYQQSGTGTSATIPAGTLVSGLDYQGRLRFVHTTASNTSDVPGAIGSVGYFKETQFVISTGGGGGGTTGGGTGDTTPPTLIFTTPTSGATGVSPSTPVMFVFTEPMARQQSIQWSANINPANISYSWGLGDQSLTATHAGGFPANATVTWALNGGANGFKDVAGNPLTAGAQGSFSTGSTGGSTGGGTGGGTNDPCTSTNQPPSGAGSGALFKSLQYEQTGNALPVAATNNPATASGLYNAATNQTVTAVRITGPNGLNLNLSNLFGQFFAFQEFPTAATLDAGFPAGPYTITATGAGSGTLTVPNVSTIPVPRFSNLVELLAFDPTKDFTLRFAPFTGAKQFDSIFISITAPNGDHFYAPDYCLNRTLSNNATSVVIPANTFKVGDKLSGSISFSTLSFDTNAIPNTSLTAAGSVTTSFETETTGGSDVIWNAPVIGPTGTITFSAQAQLGTTLRIQRSTDLKTWVDVATLPSTGGTVSYTVDPKAGGKYAFFRAIVQ